MPKLPHVSGAEALRAFQNLGCEKMRQRGRQVAVRRGSKGCVIPMHSELKIGTLSGLLRQADVSAEEFIAAL